MDPLSGVLSLLKPASSVSSGFDAGGDWAVQFPDNVGIKCYAVVKGQCWLVIDGVEQPLLLKTGECFLLPGGRAFRLASAVEVAPVAYNTVFPPARPGGVVTLNGGGDFFLVGSRFALAGQHAAMLLGLLPPVLHIQKKADRAALRWSVERMMQELDDRQPGGFLVTQHLAHMMLIQALRVHLAQGASSDVNGVGWLFALADKQIGAAINAIHAAPAQAWSVQSLAGEACMSRSAFARKFKDTVGQAPMDYLTRWRMLLAGDRLQHSSDSIAVIAAALGYESESAFSTAFKRVMKSSPRHYKSGAMVE